MSKKKVLEYLSDYLDIDEGLEVNLEKGYVLKDNELLIRFKFTQGLQIPIFFDAREESILNKQQQKLGKKMVELKTTNSGEL